MCGIAGVFKSKTSQKPLCVETAKIRPLLAHRGPDGFGVYSTRDISLFHWRLAILDLSDAGSQPMLSSCGRYVIIYNGEVYNFKELRAQIDKKKSIKWRGESDTEVVLEGYALIGEEFIRSLNGMFVLAIYDIQTNSLTIARDRFGIKPIYLSVNSDRLAFASETKFILDLKDEPFEINEDTLSFFLTYGVTGSTATMHNQIFKLRPGEIVKFNDRLECLTSQIVKTESDRKNNWTEEKAISEIRRILRNAVERQLVSDVPIGVLLSGGVDSSILAGLATSLAGREKLDSFTLVHRTGGDSLSEIDEAREIAKFIGIRHHEIEITIDDMVRQIESMAYFYDQPFSDAAALNLLALMEKMKQNVKVALSGEGADELFGGYRRYSIENVLCKYPILWRIGKAVSRPTKLLRAAHKNRRIQILIKSLEGETEAERYSAYLESGTSSGDLVVPKFKSAKSPCDEIKSLYRDFSFAPPVSKMCLVDQHFWLPNVYLEKADRGSMANGIELRVPYLDNEVVNFANTLPDSYKIRGRKQKWILKTAFENLVPKGTFDRSKKGFSVPISEWLRGHLRDYYSEKVLSSNAYSKQYLCQRKIEGLFKEHCEDHKDRSNILWPILVLEMWLRRWGADSN